jgi:hypothetical protein
MFNNIAKLIIIIIILVLSKIIEKLHSKNLAEICFKQDLKISKISK